MLMHTDFFRVLDRPTQQSLGTAVPGRAADGESPAEIPVVDLSNGAVCRERRRQKGYFPWPCAWPCPALLPVAVAALASPAVVIDADGAGAAGPAVEGPEEAAVVSGSDVWAPTAAGGLVSGPRDAVAASEVAERLVAAGFGDDCRGLSALPAATRLQMSPVPARTAAAAAAGRQRGLLVSGLAPLAAAALVIFDSLAGALTGAGAAGSVPVRSSTALSSVAHSVALMRPSGSAHVIWSRAWVSGQGSPAGM